MCSLFVCLFHTLCFTQDTSLIFKLHDYNKHSISLTLLISTMFGYEISQNGVQVLFHFSYGHCILFLDGDKLEKS